MDTIVKVLNEKVADGDAKTIVEALKQIDPNAEGETVAEVLKNMNLGGGGSGGGNVRICHMTIEAGAGVDLDSYSITDIFDAEAGFMVLEDGKVRRNYTTGSVPKLQSEYDFVYEDISFFGIDEDTVIVTFEENMPSHSFSNLVNCSFFETNALVPTDKTKDCSITLTINSPK